MGAVTVTFPAEQLIGVRAGLTLRIAQCHAYLAHLLDDDEHAFMRGYWSEQIKLAEQALKLLAQS
jgi:hypothetical protein